MNQNYENDTDIDNDIDNGVLDALGTTLAGQGMTTSLDSVVARGRRTRNRHRAVAAGIGTSAAALVAAIGVLAPSTGGAAGPVNAAGVSHTPGTAASTSAQHRALDIENVNFSVKSTGDGHVSLSFKTADVFDPAKLKSAFAEAGIPADVQLMTVDPVPNHYWVCAPSTGVTELPSAAIVHGPTAGTQTALTIDADKMPSGSVLTFALQSYTKQVGSVPGGKIVVTSYNVFSGAPGTCVPTLRDAKYSDLPGQ